jgi:hypothetical protein
MSLYLFALVIAIEVFVNWFFFRAEKQWAIVICTAVNSLAFSLLILAGSVLEINFFIILAPVMLLQAVGYKLFFITNWKKALLASLLAITTVLLISFFLSKIYRFQ